MRKPEPVPLLIPDLPAPEVLMPYLQRMHAAQHYSNFGPLVRELETRLLQRFVERSTAALSISTVANATLGLELVLTALDLRPHSRVLVPSLTFVATATAVLRAGHIPVLADVDAGSWLLTPDIARAAIRDIQVDVVMPVASFGAPHDMAAWHAFEQETGIPVVIDAAGAYGSQWLESPGGTIVFSMHATKSLPAGEGGFVVSCNASLMARIRELSNFGINLNTANSMPVGTLASIGTNAKMSEYHAAVALASLDIWDSRAAVRRGLYARLQQNLDRVAGGSLRWQAVAAPVAAPTLLCLRLATTAARASLENECARQAIATRRWYQPLLGRMLAVTPHCVCLPAPQATAIASDMCGLPFFPHMAPHQESRLAAALQAAMPFQSSYWSGAQTSG